MSSENHKTEFRSSTKQSRLENGDSSLPLAARRSPNMVGLPGNAGSTTTQGGLIASWESARVYRSLWTTSSTFANRTQCVSSLCRLDLILGDYPTIDSRINEHPSCQTSPSDPVNRHSDLYAAAIRTILPAHLDILPEENYIHLECLLKSNESESNCFRAHWIS
jgi:hypothetical protein